MVHGTTRKQKAECQHPASLLLYPFELIPGDMANVTCGLESRPWLPFGLCFCLVEAQNDTVLTNRSSMLKFIQDAEIQKQRCSFCPQEPRALQQLHTLPESLDANSQMLEGVKGESHLRTMRGVAGKGPEGRCSVCCKGSTVIEWFTKHLASKLKEQ